MPHLQPTRAAYEAPGTLRRTVAQRADPHLAWDRPDAAFFADGACHILAWALLRQHPHKPVRIVALRRQGDRHASHVIASYGAWAFDYAGWTPKEDLVAAIARYEARELEQLHIGHDLAAFCAEHDHRLPEQFAYDPWPRARAFFLTIGGDRLPDATR